MVPVLQWRVYSLVLHTCIHFCLGKNEFEKMKAAVKAILLDVNVMLGCSETDPLSTKEEETPWYTSRVLL